MMKKEEKERRKKKKKKEKRKEKKRKEKTFEIMQIEPTISQDGPRFHLYVARKLVVSTLDPWVAVAAMAKGSSVRDMREQRRSGSLFINLLKSWWRRASRWGGALRLDVDLQSAFELRLSE